MINRFLDKIKSKHWFSDAVYAVIFGLLSTILGYIQFVIPAMERAHSDFREIPLLISIFYIKNPLFIIITSLLTAISSSEGTPYLATFTMHWISLSILWIAYQKIKSTGLTGLTKSVVWIIDTLIYYLCLLIPIMILSFHYLGIDIGESFFSIYASTIQALQFEIITTALVSTLYMVQMDIRDQLKKQNENLEILVRDRTADLVLLNEKLKRNNSALIASNKQIKMLNENLDQIAKERFEQIQIQLEKLLKYSHMNSHEVRAPLARILGLVHLLKIDRDKRNKADLYLRIKTAAEELDEVIKKMNYVLLEDPLLKEA